MAPNNQITALQHWKGAQETSKSITLIHGTINSTYGTTEEVCLTGSYRPPEMETPHLLRQSKTKITSLMHYNK